MEGLVLLGGFLGFGLFGYYVVSRLDTFLEALRAGQVPDRREERYHLNVATSSPCAVPVVLGTLRDMEERYPHLRCTLSVGEENELLQALSAGTVDIVIVSAEAVHDDSVRQRGFAIRPQPFVAAEGEVMIQPVDTEAHQ